MATLSGEAWRVDPPVAAAAPRPLLPHVAIRPAARPQSIFTGTWDGVRLYFCSSFTGVRKILRIWTAC